MDGTERQLHYQHNHIQRFPRKINYYHANFVHWLNYISISKKKSRLKSNGRNGTGYAVHKLRMSDYEIKLYTLQKIKFPICKKYKGILYKVVLWS